MESLKEFTPAHVVSAVVFSKDLVSAGTSQKHKQQRKFSWTTLRPILLLLFSTTSLFADPISRRNWILEQLSTPIAQPSAKAPPSTFRASLNATNYSDAFSGMVGLLGDLGPLEIAAYASQRVYGSFTDSGREYKDASGTDSDSIAAELARGYMTRDGQYGRLGAQYIYFPKNKTAFLRLGVNMGVFEKEDSPWILRLNTHIYFRAQGDENKTYSSEVEVGQRIGEVKNAAWRLGFFFGWTYKTRDGDDIAPPVGETIRNEHMLFSIGPWLEYSTIRYNVKLGVPWRIWLDKEKYTEQVTPEKSEKIIHYPTYVRLPDLQLNLSLFL